jgi:hypothetical protein
MITLTAEIEVNGANTSPFILGESPLGKSFFGEEILQAHFVNKTNILSCETEIRDRADIDKPSFGLISSGGTLSFKDPQKKFLNYANMKVLRGGEKVSIFLENTTAKAKEVVGNYFVKNWDYDNENFIVTVSFVDGIETIQEKTMQKQDYFASVKIPSSLYDAFWSRLHSTISSNGFHFNGEAKNKFDEITRKICSTTFYNEKDSVWASFNKISQLLGAHAFINKSGEIFVKTDLNWS